MAATTETVYTDLLRSLQINNKTMVATVPSETEFIDIDLEKREILLGSSSYSQFLGVVGEHYATTVYFRVPRYYDGVDLFRMSCAVEYINPLGQPRLSPILVSDIMTEPGYILFGWCLHGDALREVGELQFAIRFFSINLDTHEFTYSLRTRPVVGRIVPSTDDRYTETETLTSQLAQELVESLKQKSLLYWTNV